jgi:hypothetical protein
MALLFTGFFVFMFGSAFAAVTEIVHPALVALVGMMLLMVGGVVAGMAGDRAPTALPQPPAIPSPAPVHAPAPAVMDCPNCGAPPRAIDRFGVATCEYCETRFVVR